MSEGTSIGQIHYELDLDDSKFKAGAAKAKDGIGGIKDSLESAERGSQIFMASVVAAGAVAVGFAAKAVQAFNESERAVTQLEAVIKSTGGAAGRTSLEFQAQAAALQQLTGISDEASMASQAMLSTFTDVRGEIMDRALPAVADLATAMGGGMIPNADQMRQTSIMLGKALNDPILGLTAMRRVGIQFNEQQQEQIKTLTESGKKAEAQGIILEELKRQFGGSAEAAGKTFAGQVTLAKENFGDFMELVGQGIANSLKPLATGFTEWFNSIGGAQGLFDRFKGFMEKLKENLPIIAGVIIAGITPALYGMALGVWAVMAPLLPFLAIGALVGLALKALIDKFGGLSGLMAAMQPILQKLGDIFNTYILPVLQAVWGAFLQLWDALKNLWATLEPILMPVLKVLGVILGVVILGAIMAFVGALYVVISVIRIVINVVSAVIGWIKDLFSWFWRIGSEIGRALGNVFNAIVSPFRQAFNWIKDKVGSVVDALKKLNPFARFSPSLVDLVTRGTKAVTGQYGAMFNNISDMANSVKPNINFAATSPISSVATAPLAAQPIAVSISAGAFMGTPGDARRFAEMVQGQVVKIERQAG